MAEPRMRLRTVLLLITAILVLIIVLQNTESVETRILFVTIAMPRVLLLLLMALLGFVAGIFVGKSRKAPKPKES